MRSMRHSRGCAQKLRTPRRARPAFRRLLFEAFEERTLLAGDSGALFDQPAVGEGPADPLMRFTVQALAAGTDTPITSILAGRDFDLQILVEDIRTEASGVLGVFAGYTDLFYDKSLARVRVAEVQTLTFVGVSSGTFTLAISPEQTTAPIDFDLTLFANRRAVALEVETALNNLLGAGTVRVNQIRNLASYEIWFFGQHDVDQPLLEASLASIRIEETVQGDPTNAASFTEAFRSRNLGLDNGSPSPYQNDLFAVDASDRVDDVGAFGFGDVGIYELVRARLKARLPGIQASGELVFLPDPASIEVPTHNNLVFADITTDPPKKSHVPPEAIVVVPAALVVKRALVAGPAVAELDEDHTVGIAIPLLPLVVKDPAAPPGAIELRSFTQPAAGGMVVRLDPKNTSNDLTDDLVRFVPAPDFNGTASFTYTAGIVGDTIPDDVGINTVTVTVQAVNDAPVNAVPVGQETMEDVPVVFSAANNDAIGVSDIDAEQGSVQVALTATGGKLTLAVTTNLAFTSGDGADDSAVVFRGTTAAVNAALAGLVFTPTEHFSGTASLTITTSDQGNTGKTTGTALEDQDSISIIVAAVNDAPAITAPATQSVFSINTLPFSTAYGNAISVADVDAGSDGMILSIATTNDVGRVRAVAAGNAQVVGNGSFQLTIAGSLGSINATLQSFELVPLQAGESGTLSVLASDLGHNPGPPKTAQATINVSVLAAVGPFAANDSPDGFIEGSSAYSIDVLSNDLTNGTAQARLVSFTQPAIGSVERDNNDSPTDFTDDKLIYRPPLKNGLPDLDFFTPIGVPPIVFSYIVNETSPTASPDSAPGTVSIRIANLPDAPTANSDGAGNSYATSIGVPIARNAAQGLLANDSVIDNAYGDPLVASLSIAGAAANSPLVVNTAAGGIATLNLDGSFSYSPPAEFVGNDTFTYQAHSSLGPDSTAATVTIHVSPPPLAENDGYTTAQEDQPFVSPTSVLANDNDLADGEQLSAVLMTNVPAEFGSVTLQSNGFFTYTPQPQFNTTRPPAPPISFTYKVIAPSGRESAPDRLATVSIAVNETNDDPAAVNDAFRAVQQKGPLGVDQPVSVVGNDTSDPDGQETLTVIGVNGVVADASGNAGPVVTASGGFVRLEGFQIQYTSPADPGSDSFTYTIGDGRGGSATAQVQVGVIPVYDYGDAADSYGTVFDSEGARHVAVGPQLGALRDEEGDAAVSNDADADDLNRTDDEDGLVATTLARGKPSSLTVAVITDAPGARLDAWIDFNRDGAFSADEKISDSKLVTTGNVSVEFSVPPATATGAAIARVRISTIGSLGPAGLALDGEVEDHVVTVREDLVLDLPTGDSPNRIAIRKNGENIEVFDQQSGVLIGSQPLAVTHAVVVRGSNSAADEMTVDYAFGGFFPLPGGVLLDAGENAGDRLIVQGATNSGLSVRHAGQGQSPGNSTLITTLETAVNDIQGSGFEHVEIIGAAAFEVIGTLNIGGETLTFDAQLQIRLGTQTLLAGGTIDAPGGIFLAAGQSLQGYGAVNGRIAADANSNIEATGSLMLGDSAMPDGVALQGQLFVNGNAVTLLDADQAVLGLLTVFGGAGVPGSLVAANGIVLGLGHRVEGFGTLDTPNDPLKAVVNDGVIQGNSAAEPITLVGFVMGTGALDHAVIAGTLSPGASPAAVEYGNLEFDASATLIVELGGTAAGNGYDQLNFSGNAKLAGKLQMVLIGGYEPQIDDAFSLLTAVGTLSGQFLPPDLPSLPGDRKWKLMADSSEIRLAVVTVFPWHNRLKSLDVDGDDHIVANDALDVINFLNAFGASDVPVDVPNVAPFLDVVPDNVVSAGDALEIINFVNAGLGGEGESTKLPALEQALPAPSQADLFQLLATDVASQSPRRRRFA